MKNTLKLIGIVAIIAMIGLVMVTCGEPSAGGRSSGGTAPTYITPQIDYVGFDNEAGAMYRLRITGQSVVPLGYTTYTPRQGDGFELVRFLGGDIERAMGNVQNFTVNNFTLQQGANSFVVPITGDFLNSIPSNINIDGGGTMTPSTALTPTGQLSFSSPQIYYLHPYFFSLGEEDPYRVLPLPPGVPIWTNFRGQGIGGHGAINNSGNGFSFNIGIPRILWTIDDIILELMGIDSFKGKISVDKADTPAAFLNMLINGVNPLNFEHFTQMGAIGNHSLEVINFIYVVDDCTVTIAQADSGLIDDDPDDIHIFHLNAATLELKQGWNWISSKVTIEKDLTQTTITLDYKVVSELPLNGKWVM